MSNGTGPGHAGIPEIDVQQLKAMLDSEEDIVLIDVREPNEHAVCHLAQAELVPLQTLPTHVANLDKTKRYVVHCKLGGRSAQAVNFMRQQGFDATNVAGGIKAWVDQIDPTMATYW